MMVRVHQVAEHLFSRLNESRVKSEYCDITVHVDDKSFRCHRIVLGAMSEYFHTMFNSNFKESHADHITLEAIDAPTFAEVVNFVYTGEIVITDENVFSLLVASEYLKLPYVETLCIEHLEEMDYISNAIDIFIFSHLLEKESLRSVVSANIFENFHTISRTIRFLELPFKDCYQLLDGYKNDGSYRSFRGPADENNILNVIERWISHARDDRLLHFHELIHNNIIDLENINPEYLWYVKKKLFVTDAVSSFKDSRVYASRSTSSLHVFVGFKEDLVDVFSWAHYDNNWHHSCTLSPDSINYGFHKNYPSSPWIYTYRYPNFPDLIKHVSIGSHLYCLIGDEISQQRFCTASSIDFKQDFKILEPPPLIFRNYDLCASRNGIYLFGNASTFRINDSVVEDILGFDYEPFIHSVCSYKQELDKWLPVAQPKKMCYEARIISDDNLVYIIGKENSRALCGYIQAYDSRTSRWQELGTPQFEVANDVACCIHKGKIYVNGGLNGAGQTNVFDPVAGKWQRGASNIYANRSRHKLISYRECVWAIGEDREGCDSLIMEVYDTVNEKWCIVEALDDFVTESIIWNGTVYSEYPKRILDAVVLDSVE